MNPVTHPIRLRTFYVPRMALYCRFKVFWPQLRGSNHKGYRQYRMIGFRLGWRYWSARLEVQS